MSEQRKNIVLISGSPKISEASVSELLVTMAQGRLSDSADITKIDARRSLARRETEKDFDAMTRADAIIIVFPLYFFCLPGVLIRFLQDYASYRSLRSANAGGPKVYTIVNCGFPEPEINGDAVRVIKSFCDQTGASFRFGIMLGGGGMLLGAKDAPFMKKFMEKLNTALDNIAKDIEGGDVPLKNVTISVKIPRKFYLFMGNLGWGQLAKKNGLKKKDLRARPYQ